MPVTTLNDLPYRTPPVARHFPARACARTGLRLHDYRADIGGTHGSEWTASLRCPLRGKRKALLKLADYHADGFARDTTKLWLLAELQR